MPGRRRSVPGYNTGLALMEERSAANWLDPADFAIRVRELAVEAYRVLKDPDTSYGEAVELSRKFDELRRQRRREHAPERELDRWLRNAAKQVRDYRPSPRSAQPVG
jgi:hypothetical protein